MRVICGVTCGGVSHAVIYVCAVSVSAPLNALWAATLTEYGPVCKGERMRVIDAEAGVGGGQM